MRLGSLTAARSASGRPAGTPWAPMRSANATTIAAERRACRWGGIDVWCWTDFRTAMRPPSYHPLACRGEKSAMYRIRQSDLPFQGSSHRFVGADHGDVNVSVFLLSALPGKGPGP